MRISPSSEPVEQQPPAEPSPEGGSGADVQGEAEVEAEVEGGTQLSAAPPTATAAPATATATPYDVALVLVHGMGNAYTSQILLEWAEPIFERMDWLTRDRLIGGEDRHGVRVHESTLAGDFPMVTATVRFPGTSAQRAAATAVETGADIPTSDAADDVVRRVAVIEARWSESFVPMSRSQVFKWAVPFLWRTVWRVMSLFWGTMVLVPMYTLRKHWYKPPGSKRVLPPLFDLLIDLVRLLVGVVAVAVTGVFLLVVSLIMSVVLPLLSPLLLFKWFQDLAQKVIDGVVESIGDVAAWKERPLRASAMRLVVRNALEQAKALVGDGDVHLFAHSQGAAVSTFALLEELTPKDYNVRQLTTVGAAVVLLGREKWRGRPDKYHPVQNWIDKNKDLSPGERVEWTNHWAIWDPFSAGPIADTRKKRRERWRSAYFPEAASSAYGPEEHAVHNTSQPFLDHSMYFENTVQVVEPTARQLLGPDFPPASPSVQYIENRLAVIDKKSLGINMFAAVVIAAILPGLPGVHQFFDAIITWIAGAVGWLIGFFPGGDTPEAAIAAAVDSVAFITDDPVTVWSWLVEAALILAALIFLNQWIARITRRAREWDRCPVKPRAWLTLTSIPRLLYVLGAFVSIYLGILVWGQPSQFWSVISAVLLLVAAFFVFIEPFYAPVPVVVKAHVPPEQQSLLTAPVALSTPTLLGAAMKEPSFAREIAARRRLLEPQGWRARWWATWFHGWRKGATPTPLAESAAPDAPSTA